MTAPSLNDSMHLPFYTLSSREGTGPERTLIGSPCHSQMITKLCGTGHIDPHPLKLPSL